MNIFGNNSLSTFFYYLTKIGFWCAVGFLGFIAISMLLGFLTYWLDWENSLVSLSIAEEFQLEIKPLDLRIEGEMGMPTIIPIVIVSTAVFYTAILWFLQRMFKNFMSLPIFKQDVVSSLQGLAYTFAIAAILSFCMIWFSPHSDADFVLGVVLLFIIAPILFFIKAIFEQGMVVQEENELTI